MRTLNKNKKGFSLIEVVVALGILAFVFAGTVTLIVQIVSLELSARNKTEAVAFAQKLMAETVTDIGEGCAKTNPGANAGKDPTNFYNYSVNINETFNEYTNNNTPVGFNNTNFYQVEVVVTWDNRDSQNNRYEIKQMIKK